MDEDEAVKARRSVDVLWQDYGERGTFWFHALAHDAALAIRAAYGTLPSLSADDATECAVAANTIADHYAALFAICPTAAAAHVPDGVPHARLRTNRRHQGASR